MCVFVYDCAFVVKISDSFYLLHNCHAMYITFTIKVYLVARFKLFG